jgi:hypothetical protein
MISRSANYITISYAVVGSLRRCPKFRKLSQEDKTFINSNHALGFTWVIDKNKLPKCCDKLIIGSETNK